MKFKTNKGAAIAKQLLTKLGSKSKTMAVVAALFASIIRKTKRKRIFKRSDKTRKTKCTPEKSPFSLRLRTK